MSSVTEALLHLRAKAARSAAELQHSKAAAQAKLKERSPGSLRHTPSGPRRKSEGIEEEHQEILAAEPTCSGGATLRVTLLAAGFVIGPSGASVREICAITGADIRSWTESWGGRRVRTLVVEGKRRSVVHALEVISAAVERYNELCGGAYCGLVVDRAQSILGIRFMYSPPPRAAVPYAAALRTQHADSASSPSPPTRKALDFATCSAADKENAAAAQLAAAAGSAPSAAHLGALLQAGGPHVPDLTPAGLAHAGAGATGGQPLLGGLRRAALSPLRQLRTAAALPAGMDVDVDAPSGGLVPAAGAAASGDWPTEEATTPAYRTTYTAATTAAASAAYSLFPPPAAASGFSSGTPLAGHQQPTPYTAATGSFFISAFEEAHLATPTTAFLGPPAGSFLPLLPTQQSPGPGRGLGCDAATPLAVTPALLRSQSNSGEDALLAATGFKAFGEFAAQSPFFTPALFSEPLPAAAPTPAVPAPQLPLLPAVGSLTLAQQLPAGSAAGCCEWWRHSMHGQQQHP